MDEEGKNLEEFQVFGEGSAGREFSEQEELFQSRSDLAGRECGQPSGGTRRPRGKNRGAILAAATALTAIVTTAVVVNLSSVSVLSFRAGFTDAEYVMKFEHIEGPLTARLMVNGDVLYTEEREPGEELRFYYENLDPKREYLFSVRSRDGEPLFEEAFRTLSPVRFYSKSDDLMRRYVGIDESFAGKYVELYGQLTDSEGGSYPLEWSSPTEWYFYASGMQGTYWLELYGQTEDGQSGLIYTEEIEI